MSSKKLIEIYLLFSLVAIWASYIEEVEIPILMLFFLMKKKIVSLKICLVNRLMFIIIFELKIWSKLKKKL